ncbi:DUF4893 domain-containing protein [Phenylobacterium sp.]|uniref:DUF4893 domain-containing protein n=1 Tax=Phenylobacterium sp. TaxID=1871053 RepID=UPI0035AF5BF8
MRRPIALALVLTAAALPAFAASADWRRDARPADARRLARLDEAWSQALREARAGSPRQLRALGPLADPAAALPSRPQPTPGPYRCRTVKLGGISGATAYGWFRCRVELTPGGDLILAKTTGSQRPTGHLYPDGERRLVYLGAVAWGNEGPARYGRDPERDQVGVVERIGPQTWRLVLPFPKQESTLDIIELRR